MMTESTSDGKGAEPTANARSESSGVLLVLYKGAVLNVASFLNEHPGGKQVLLQRGGKDITGAFDAVGHSERARDKLYSLQVAVFGNTKTGVGEAPPPKSVELAPDVLSILKSVEWSEDNDADELGESVWHAKRREEILKEHPEIAKIAGPCVWTLLFGVAISVLHSFGTVYAAEAPGGWIVPASLGYTLGAFCKMYHFAIAHEICHGNVLPYSWTKGLSNWIPFVTHDVVHNILLRALTVPAVSNEIYEYYANLHLPHHARLGAGSLLEHVETLDKTGAGFDGDMLSPGTLGLSSRIQKGKRVTPLLKILGIPHEGWLLFLLSPILHILHYLYMMQWAVACVLAIPMGGICAQAWLCEMQNCASSRQTFEDNHQSKERREEETHRARRFVVLSSLGLQVIFNLFVVGVLLRCWGPLAQRGVMPTWVAVRHGFIYLIMSELSFHGFLWHPYGAYFLTVHRSPRKSGEPDDGPRKPCQPTMSSYSTLAALASGGLTYHVEHHDFPQVACWRLPQITKAAPEFYHTLETSGGFWSALFEYWTDGAKWHYACQGVDEDEDK